MKKARIIRNIVRNVAKILLGIIYLSGIRIYFGLKHVWQNYDARTLGFKSHADRMQFMLNTFSKH